MLNNTKDIAPLSKTKRSSLSRFKLAKHRRKEKKFFVEGYKNVIDLMNKGKFELLWLGISEDFFKQRANESDLLIKAEVSHGMINLCNEGDMKTLSCFSTPSEVLALFAIPNQDDNKIDNLPQGLYLLLDEVQDPGNLGTIIRTAHWFGIKSIFASENCVDLYNPKTVQSTMGSLGEVDVIYTDLIQLLAMNPSIPAVGLELNGENLFESTLPSSAFICMGSEGHGLSASIRDKLKESFTIPPADDKNHPESLNVAIATAITLACFCR